MAVRIGLIGKTNAGKTTFFNAATLSQAEVNIYPFTTKEPNQGMAFVVTLCVCKELGVKDDPQNSSCMDGWRYIPIELWDLPGLIKGASVGRGLGTKFLTVASASDALIHVVDASGSIDEDGNIAEPGTGDPVRDFEEIEGELVSWYKRLIENNHDKISKEIKYLKPGRDAAEAIAEPLKGAKVNEEHVKLALNRTGLHAMDFGDWSDEQLWKFAGALREISKPTIILANKIDVPGADRNYKRLRDTYKDMIVVPASSEAELALRKAEKAKLIKYIPGSESFEVLNEGALTDKQKWALGFIERFVMREFLRTGVQFALNVAVFKLLRMNVVYPVYDSVKLSDKYGHILPDALLLPEGASVRELAKEIHSELAKGLLYAIDARTGLRLPVDYKIKDRDVISIISAVQK
jgi:hypothetical protein